MRFILVCIRVRFFLILASSASASSEERIPARSRSDVDPVILQTTSLKLSPGDLRIASRVYASSVMVIVLTDIRVCKCTYYLNVCANCCAVRVRSVRKGQCVKRSFLLSAVCNNCATCHEA